MNQLIFASLFFFLTFCFSEEPKVKDKQNSFYLDVAASWKINEEALLEFVRVNKLDGNSSGINSHAKHLRHLEEESTKVIASKIGANSDQIHFTCGATTANNIAILGVAYKHPKCHLITSKIEHKSVINVFKHLEKLGYKVTYLDVDKHGSVDLNQLRQEKSVGKGCEKSISETKHPDLNKSLAKIQELVNQKGKD